MRILFLSTYAASAPDSGGVIRLRALQDVLASAGHDTHVLAVVLGGAGTGSARETVVTLSPATFSAADRAAIGFHDVLTGLRCLDDADLMTRARDLVRGFKPDAIVLEQPFLFDLAQALREAAPAVLVYSAANREEVLKRDLIALVPQHFAHPEDLLGQVARVEREAARASSLVVAIAADMEAELSDWGARQVATLGNGARGAATATDDPRHPLAAMLRRSEFTCFGCFGSAYWPNVEGLASVLYPSLAFLPLDAKLIMSGQMPIALRQHRSYDRGRALNDTRLVSFGHLPGADFDVLVGSCDALLLPVFVGSGSPLKTADALASGRPVLMSRTMAKGYEDVIAQCPDGVRIVEDPAAFRAAWQEWARLGKAGLAALAGEGHRRAELLTWPNRLKDFGDLIGQAVRAGDRPETGSA